MRTTWNANVAMHRGWAIAELWLPLRDSLLFEDGDRLILFAGLPAKWFNDPAGIEIARAPTYFGNCSIKNSYDTAKNEATIELAGPARPPGGFVIRLSHETSTSVRVGERRIEHQDNGDLILPAKLSQD